MEELNGVLAEMEQIAPVVHGPHLRAVDVTELSSMASRFKRRMTELAHKEFRDDHPEIAERERDRARLAAISAGKKKRQLVNAKVWIPVGRDAESANCGN